MILRVTSQENLDDLMRLWNDGRVMQWVGFPDGLGYDRGAAQGWFDKLRTNPQRHHFVVLTRENRFCGEAYYKVDPDTGRAGLDIKLLPEVQMKGLGTDALRILIRHVFQVEVSVDAVWTQPSQLNVAAQALYTRCGLKSKPIPSDNQAGESYWELTRAEWNRIRWIHFPYSELSYSIMPGWLQMLDMEIINTANQILADEPEAIIRIRLLRDVLGREPDDADLLQAKHDAEKSPWVANLSTEQKADGSWGAFHSRDSRVKQKIPTTEMGVARAINLGLDASHPILGNTAKYLQQVMDGELPFPDRPEKNTRWKTGKRLFVAATYARIQPHDSRLNADRELWLEIASRTFQSGAYNAGDEALAHEELTGASVKDSYLVMNGKYQLLILGSIPNTLAREMEHQILRWLWNLPWGIGYLSVPLNVPPALDKPGEIDRWLTSLELLAHCFPTWVEFAQEAVEWLWDQQRLDGRWDFGSKPRGSTYLPLSSSWRRKGDRVIDWSTRILVLLSRFTEPQKPGINLKGARI